MIGKVLLFTLAALLILAMVIGLGIFLTHIIRAYFIGERADLRAAKDEMEDARYDLERATRKRRK